MFSLSHLLFHIINYSKLKEKLQTIISHSSNAFIIDESSIFQQQRTSHTGLSIGGLKLIVAYFSLNDCGHEAHLDYMNVNENECTLISLNNGRKVKPNKQCSNNDRLY